MSEQIIIQIPDSATGAKLKEFLKKLNLKYTVSAEDDSISEEEKEYVLDILNSTAEEDYVSYEDVKKRVKSLFLPAIPRNKYRLIMKLLKELNVPAIEDGNRIFTLTEEHKNLLDRSLQKYLENPNNVQDFDEALKDIRNGL